MANLYGPRIVTDGLGLYLDSKNKKSYPGSGSSWYDISGNNRHFSGNSGYIDSDNGIRSGVTWSCPASSIGNLLNTDYHSIFFAIKFNSTASYANGTTGGWNQIFQHTGSSGDRSPSVWRYPSNRTLHWRYNPNNTGRDFGPSGSSGDFNLNTWFIVGLTKDGGTARAYVNGNQVTSGSVSNPKTTGSSIVRLFSGYPASLANMNLLTVYTYPLNTQDVSQNYNALKGRFGL
jgi:hypothetical protein